MIDEALIPSRLLVDTGVLIRALEYRSPKHKDDERTKHSRALWVAALQARREVLIAAPTLVELRADPQAPPAPLVPPVRIVSFTRQAAEELSIWGNLSAIQAVTGDSGVPRRVAKWDALIVACAKVHRAACIVTLDRDVQRLAARARIEAKAPDAFLKRQLSLPGAG